MGDTPAQENMRQMLDRLRERFRAEFMAAVPHLQHELQGRDPATLTMRQMMDIADRNKRLFGMHADA